jgi:hypothetical protein
MKKFLTLLFISISFGATAENWRKPAVLPGCNLPENTTYQELVNGKMVVKNKTAGQVQKELCLEARNCMNTATDDEMVDLKNLEAAACSNVIKAVTTKVPSTKIVNDFNGKREAKNNPEREIASPTTTSKKTTAPK